MTRREIADAEPGAARNVLVLLQRLTFAAGSAARQMQDATIATTGADMDAALIKAARDEASKLVKETLTALAQPVAANAGPAKDTTEPRLFFPAGIELLYFKLAFGKEIDITIAIAGEKAKYPATSAAAVLAEAADGDGDRDGTQTIANEG